MGTLTTNGYFYKPNLGAAGTAELALFHASLDTADAKIAELDAKTTDLPVYANNAAALVGGLASGDFYRTATGILMVVY